MGEEKRVYKVLMGKPEGRRPLGRTRCGWVIILGRGNGGDCIHEELNDLYSSPNIVRVIKWRRMGWAGHVARTGEERGVCRVLLETTGET